MRGAGLAAHAVRAGRGEQQGVAGGQRAVRAGALGEPLGRAAVRVDQVDVLVERVALAGLAEQPVADPADDAADLQAGGVQRLAVHGQAAGLGRVQDGEQSAVGQPVRGAGQVVDPELVCGAGEFGGDAGGRVGAQQQHVLLQPVGDGEQQLLRAGPPGGAQVGEGPGVPAEFDPGVVQAEHPEPDVRVGAAGLRVGEPLGVPLRVRRVGEVPGRHGGLVHPGGEHGAAVGAPPVAPVAAQFLGGGELGDAPAGAVVRAEAPVGAAGRGGDVQGVVGDVGDALAGRVGAGVEDGAGGGEFGGAAGRGLGAEEPAVEGEDGDGEVGGGAEGADAGGGEPGPLAQPALDVGQVGGGAGAAGGQHGRIGDLPLGTGGEVEEVEPVEPVLGTAGAEQQQAGTVLVERDRSRGTEAEAAGPGAEGEVGVGDGHRPMVAVERARHQ